MSAGTAITARGDDGAQAAAPARRGNPFARLVTYVRQVVAELRKVIWPTRNELITYTTVVLVFVAVMMIVVAAYDFAFAKAVIAVFGK